MSSSPGQRESASIDNARGPGLVRSSVANSMRWIFRARYECAIELDVAGVHFRATVTEDGRVSVSIQGRRGNTDEAMELALRDAVSREGAFLARFVLKPSHAARQAAKERA